MTQKLTVTACVAAGGLLLIAPGLAMPLVGLGLAAIAPGLLRQRVSKSS